MRKLLLEDDPHLGRVIQIGLEQRDHAIDLVQSAGCAVTAFGIQHYECLVLDPELPSNEGLFVLCKLHCAGFLAAILIVTGRDQIFERVAGLDSDAYDFIIKPFDLEELRARIRAVTMRVSGRTREMIFYGETKFEFAARMPRRPQEIIPFSSKECGVLPQRFVQVAQTLSRTPLEESLNEWDEEIESNALQVHLHHLCKKLGKSLITTVYAKGNTIDRPVGGQVQ